LDEVGTNPYFEKQTQKHSGKCNPDIFTNDATGILTIRPRTLKTDLSIWAKAWSFLLKSWALHNHTRSWALSWPLPAF